MATTVNEEKTVTLIDGTKIKVRPLKISLLRPFMKKFEGVAAVAEDNEKSMNILMECIQIAMKQYKPELAEDLAALEENMDLPTVYKVLNVAAGIKVDKKSEEPVKDQATESGSTWDSLDLAKLESEAFLLGIWKDYQELEESLSMPELMATLSSKRELDYEEKKFLAAIQGVDLDSQSGSSRGQKEWEDMKARVFSKGKTSDSNDILALQGPSAQKAGFGIGMGIDYEDMRDPSIVN